MARDRKKQVAVELTAPTGKLDADLRRANQIIRKRGGEMQRSTKRIRAATGDKGAGRRSPMAPAMGGMRGGAGRLGGMAKGAIAFGGFYGLQSEMRSAKAFEEVLVDLAVRGQKSKGWLGQLRKHIMAASNEFGVGKDEIASYVGTIIDQTGNTALAVKTMRDMTAVAYSTNTNMSQLAGTVVEMQSKLALAPTEFMEGLGILAAQADKGKVPLSQMAQYLPEVLNATTQFGHTGIGALREYGAVLQMAARGAGSLAEANTAMNRMLDQTAAKRGKIEETLGIKLKKDGAWMQLGPMLMEITEGLLRMQREGKDVEKFIVQTWGIRGKKALLPMMQQGAAGWGARVGADATGAGGLTSFNALMAAGGAQTITERVGRKRKLSPELEAWDKSLNKVRNQLHQHLLPALNKLGELMPAIGRGLSFVLDNWKLVLGLWTGAKMAAFFSQMMTAGRAGAAAGGAGIGVGAGGAPGRKGRWGSRGRRAAGGALAALPLVPWAKEKGGEIGEWLAGTTFEEQHKQRMDAIEGAARTKLLRFGRKNRGTYKYLARGNLQEFMGTRYGKGAKTTAAKAYTALGGDKGELDLSRLADMSPAERARTLAQVQTARSTIRSGAQRALEKTGAAETTTPEVFEKMVNRIAPAIDRLNNTQLKLETAIHAFNATDVLVKAIQASRANSR